MIKMKVLILFLVSLIVCLVQGSPLKPPVGATTDKLEGFPWMKPSKAKARFGTTPLPQVGPTTPATLGQSQPQNPPLILTNQMLQDYITALTASLQPYVVPDPSDESDVSAGPVPQSPLTRPVATPSKRPLKGKVPKQVNPDDAPSTTESYWDAERKMYPDSFYDEFYMDWLRKRQVEEIAVATPNPTDDEPTETIPQQQVQPAAASPYPTVPLSFNPYLMNPFLYPLAGMKVSKAMAQAQVNAQLAALNITTTPKPVKIKLKIPIPPGSDMAQVVSSGIAGFPAGTTYELSKK